MAGTGTLRRLLQVLSLQEEQARIALESAMTDYRLLEQRLNGALERSRDARRLIVSSAQSGNLTDRWAGLEEGRMAAARAAQLKPRIQEAEILVVNRRQEFLSKRVERRQAETLIEAAEAREAVEAGRRSQAALDEWFLSKSSRTGKKQPSSSAANLKSTPSVIRKS